MKYVWIVMLIIADAIWLWFAVMDIRATVHLNSKVTTPFFSVEWISKLCIAFHLLLIFAASLTKWLGVW